MTKQKKKRKDINYISPIISALYIILCFILIALFQWMLSNLSLFGIGSFIGADTVSDYLTVISLHFTTVFLTTGLMSTLGTKEEMIYHVDIVKRILLQPRGCNFKDLSIYAYTTLVTAVVAFICRSAYVVILSALVGTIIVSWIFFSR